MSEIESARGEAPTLGSLSIKWFARSAFCVVKSKLLGKVLTLVDASIQDQEQRKAFKDIVKDAFKSTHDLEEEIATYGETCAQGVFEDSRTAQTVSSSLAEITPIFSDGYEYTCKKL